MTVVVSFRFEMGQSTFDAWRVEKWMVINLVGIEGGRKILVIKKPVIF